MMRAFLAGFAAGSVGLLLLASVLLRPFVSWRRR